MGTGDKQMTNYKFYNFCFTLLNKTSLTHDGYDTSTVGVKSVWDLKLQEGTCAKAFLHSKCLRMIMLPFISSGNSSCENSMKKQNKEEELRTTALIHLRGCLF